MAVVGEAFVEVKPKTDRFGADAKKQLDPVVKTLGKALSGSLSVAIGTAASLGKAVLGVGTGIAALGAISAHMGLDLDAALETATLQFQTLLGSADKAKAKVTELFDFAKHTPFETGPVIAASKTLQTFGGDALNSLKRLTEVGDAAAATSAPIEEVAQAIGRAYAAIQAGKPFGEAAQRLTELAILTPQARNEIEKMAKAGKPAAQVFGVLEQSLNRFAGAMKLQEGTWQGLRSTISDTVKLASGQVFKPLFEGLKEVMGSVIELSNTPAWDAVIGHLQSLVEDGTTGLFGLASGISSLAKNLTAADVDGIFARISGAVDSVSEALGPLKPIIAGVGLAFATMAGSQIPLLGKAIPVINPVIGLMGGLLFATDKGRDALGNLASTLGETAKAFSPVLDALREVVPVLSEGLAGALNEIGPAVLKTAQAIGPALGDAIRELGPPLAELVQAGGELAASILPPLGDGFVLVLKVAARLAPLLTLAADAVSLLADNMKGLTPVIGALGVAFVSSKLGAALANGGIEKGFALISKALDAVGGSALKTISRVGPLGIALSGLAAAYLSSAADAAAYRAEVARLAEEFNEAGSRAEGFAGNLESIFKSGKDIQTQKFGAGPIGEVEKFGVKLAGMIGIGTDFTASIDDIAKSMNSVGITFEDLSQHIDDSKSLWAAWIDQVRLAAQGMGLSKDQIKDLVGGLGSLRKEERDVADKANALSIAQGKGGTAAEEAGKKYKDETDRIRDLWHTTQDAIGASIDFRKSQLDTAQALADLKQAQLEAFVVGKDSTKSDEEKAQAQRDAAAAALRYEDAIRRQAQAKVDDTAATADQTTQAGIYRDELLKLLAAAPPAEQSVIQHLIDEANKFAPAVTESVKSLGPVMQFGFDQAARQVNGNRMTEAGRKGGQALLDGAVTSVLNGSFQITSAVNNAAPTAPFPTYKAAGTEAGGSFKTGATGGLEVAQPAIQSAAEAAGPKKVDYSSGGESGARSFVGGFTGMLQRLLAPIRAAAAAAGQAAVQGLMGPIGIDAGSPSKKAAKAGVAFVQGFINPLVFAQDTVEAAGADVGDAAGKGLQSGLSYRAKLVGDDLKSFNDAVTEGLKDVRGDTSEFYDLMVQDAVNASATIQDRVNGFVRSIQVSLATARKNLAEARRAFDVETQVRAQTTPADFLGNLSLSVDQGLRSRQDAISKDAFDALTNELIANRLGMTTTQLATKDLVDEIHKNTSATLLQREAMTEAEKQLGVTSGGLTDTKQWQIVVNGLADLFTGTQFEAQTLAEQLGGTVRALDDIVSEQKAADERARAAIPLTEEESLRAAIAALQKPKELQDLRDQLAELQNPTVTNNQTINVNVTPVPTEVLAPAELAYLVEQATRLAVGVP